MLSNHDFRLICGPYGSAKSTGMCMEIFRRCANQAKGPDGKRRSRWVIIRNTADQLRDTTLKTWFEWFPAGEFGHWAATSKTFTLRLNDIEAEILFRALDDPDDVRKLKSLELTGAWINEACEIHQDVISPLRKRCGRYPSQRNRPADIPKSDWPTWAGVIADTNAPNEDSWWAKMMTGEIPNDWEVYRQPSGRSPEAENTENLPDDYYEVKMGMTEDEVRVQIDGDFSLSKSGMPVFKTFNKKIHVSESPLIYNPKLTLIVGLDPGMSTGAVIGQQDLYGRVYYLSELVTQGYGAARFADDRLRPLLRERFPDADVVICPDPASDNRSQADEQTVVQVLRKRGFKVMPAFTNKPEARIGAVDNYLSRLIDGRPALQIDPSCKQLISAYSGGYRYAINRAGITADRPDKNEHSHVADASEYLCLYFQRDGDRMARRKIQTASPTWMPADKSMGY